MELSLNVKAILNEICGALNRFAATGEEWTIFVNKMSLTFDDRQAIHDFLGKGDVRINLQSVERAEWQESSIAGIWYGVFYDHNDKPVLETIEVCSFPKVAAAQTEDIKNNIKILQEQLSNS